MKILAHSGVRLMILALGIVGIGRVAHAGQVEIVTDATWLTTAAAPATGWNTDLNFNTAGWIGAFKSPTGDHIWYGSNLSKDSPSQAWFRQTFTLTSSVTSAVGDFFFDDQGQTYLNGHLIIDHSTGGSKDFPGTNVDPSWFNLGQNLLAVHGVNTEPPDNNVGVDLVFTTAVPEPATILILPAAFLLMSRRKCRA